MAADEPIMHALTLRFPSEWEQRFHRDYFARSVGQSRLVVGFLVGWQAIYVLLLQQRTPIFFYIGLAASLLCLAAFAFSFSPQFRRHHRLIISAVILLMIFNPIARMLDGSTGRQATPTTSFMAIMFLMLVASSFARIGFVYAFATSSVTLLTALAITITQNLVTGGFGPYFLLISSFVAAMLSGYLIERHVRREYVQAYHLARERERSERLLLNILPKPIAERLKASAGTIADMHPATTILFADIVDFTSISAKSTPREMVETLNAVFTRFDALALEHGLEKIKTIGDAYMVVGGVPTPHSDHAAAAAEMALAMRRELFGYRGPTGDPIRMRIGINTGPIVAGVIGATKFAYDLWGDTVNTASRMESHGVPDGIQVTEATYELLKDRYVFEERGMIQVKGKGDMRVYLLLGAAEKVKGESPVTETGYRIPFNSPS